MSVSGTFIYILLLPIWIEIIVLGLTEAMFYGKFISKSARNNITHVRPIKRMYFLILTGIFTYVVIYFSLYDSYGGRTFSISVIFGAIVARFLMRERA